MRVERKFGSARASYQRRKWGNFTILSSLSFNVWSGRKSLPAEHSSNNPRSRHAVLGAWHCAWKNWQACAQQQSASLLPIRNNTTQVLHWKAYHALCAWLLAPALYQCFVHCCFYAAVISALMFTWLLLTTTCFDRIIVIWLHWGCFSECHSSLCLYLNCKCGTMKWHRVVNIRCVSLRWIFRKGLVKFMQNLRI